MYFKRNGFTLIELIIVLVVVSILASIAVSTFQGMKAKAVASEALLGISTIMSSLRGYCVGNDGQYPSDCGGYIVSLVTVKPEYFPGLIFRDVSTSDYSSGAGSLDGTYFSQECYLYWWNSGNPVVFIRVGPDYGSIVNKAPRKNDAVSTLDDPANASAGELIYYIKTGEIKQYGWTKTGYPSNGSSF